MLTAKILLFLCENVIATHGGSFLLGLISRKLFVEIFSFFSKRNKGDIEIALKRLKRKNKKLKRKKIEALVNKVREQSEEISRVREDNGKLIELMKLKEENLESLTKQNN